LSNADKRAVGFIPVQELAILTHCAVQKSFGSFQITSSDFKFKVDLPDHWAYSSFGIHHINMLTLMKPL